MKLKTLPFFILIIFLSFGCKKDNPQNTNPNITTSNSGHFPLKVGNYWHYDVYKVIDTSGVEIDLNYGDTIRIIAEEIINGNTYFVIEEDVWPSPSAIKDTLYLRDSSNYIVNLEGNIVFSSSDFNNILYEVDYAPASWAVEFSVSNMEENHNVPAGNFNCLNYKGRVYSTNPNNNEPDRFLHNCYSENVGIVFQTIFYASHNVVHYERRLSDYHLE